MSEPQEEVQRIQRRFGISRDQAAAMYQESMRLSQKQLERAFALTSNFITTVVTLVSSAVGFVAAFAWNNAIQTWLASASIFKGYDPVTKGFIYAIVATVFAVVVIGILGFVNARIKGRSLLPNGTLP